MDEVVCCNFVGDVGTGFEGLTMFYCSQCGICCRNLPAVTLFDELHHGDGVCKFLEGNLCSIYDTRPLLCRVDESYHLFEHSMSYEEYLDVNYKSCSILQGKE